MNQTQYENSMLLRQVILDKISKNEPEEVLDHWSSPCGTYGCVAGDFVIKSQYEGYDIDDPNRDDLSIASNRLDDKFHSYFGFSEDFYSSLDELGEPECKYVFGCRYSGTLQERLEYVESQIIENGYSLEG